MAGLLEDYMERFIWIWRTLQALSVIAFGVVWLPAQVLALGGTIPQYATSLGTCNVYREDNGSGFAYVSLGMPLFVGPISGAVPTSHGMLGAYFPVTT